VKTLIAYDGTLRLKSCCASPQNRVRQASVADVAEWIHTNGAWDDILAYSPDSSQPEREQRRAISVPDPSPRVTA